MSDESPVEPKSLGTPTVDQCAAVYRAMLEPTIRTFHAKMVTAGYAISLSGAQRFIARHIKKTNRKPHPAASVVDNQLTAEELNLIQKDLAELRPLDVDKLRPMFEREVLIYNIMLLHFSQLNADRLAMAPKESAAMVKSMFEASGKVSTVPAKTPDGQTVDVTTNEPNAISDAIRRFQLEHGLAGAEKN